jgi:O-antigen/teichoic acid export membrane protein
VERNGLTSRGGRLRHDVGLTYGSKTLVLLLSFGTTIVVARALGPSDRGVFAVALGFGQLLAQFGTLGIVAANPYYLARGEASRSELLSVSLVVAAVAGALLALGGFAIFGADPAIVRGVSTGELVIALAAIPALLGTQFVQSMLLGERRILAYNALEATVAAVSLVGLGLVLALVARTPRAALATITVISYAGLIGCLAIYLAAGTDLSLPRASTVARMLRYGLKIYVATLLSFAVVRVDLLLVNGTLGARQAGIYSIVAAIATGMCLVPTAVALNLFPRIAGGASTALTGSLVRVTAIVYGLLCLISVPLAAVAIPYVFGHAFRSAVPLFFWILPGIFSLGMQTVLSHHFAGRGFPVEAMAIWFVGLIVNLAINLAFLSHGTYVASLASSVAYFVVFAYHVRLFAREEGGYSELVPGPSDLRLLRDAVRRRSGPADANVSGG